jgi:superfamily I DNA/RNA helicase/Rad3-related DNA helicase
MTLRFRDSIADWLRELKLTEPEIDLRVPIAGENRMLLIAYPDFKFGIFEDTDNSGEIELDDWVLWGCKTDHEIYESLKEIARRFGIEIQEIIGPDLSKLKMFMDQGLWEAAEEEVNRLIESVDSGDPILLELKEYRKIIRGELRKRTEQKPTSKQVRIGKPVSQVIREDIGRIKTEDTFPHHLLGFFSQRNSELTGEVDAVWTATVDKKGSSVWTGCAVGSETQELDSLIDVFPTETELLDQLINNINDGLLIWVWDKTQLLSVLQKWHFRVKGHPLPEEIIQNILPLRAFSLIAYPIAQRTDKPENFCKEQKITFQDSLGNGGTMAAMEALLQYSIECLQAASPELQSALSTLFNPFLPEGLIKYLFPKTSQNGFDEFLNKLAEIFHNLPDPVQTCKGEITSNKLTLKDFFEKPSGFIAQVTGENYQERKGQMEFADQVLSGLQEDSPYVLEAGTGIGKTIGYLVPLLLNGKRAFIATHTKNLQDQAWYKDVPVVLKAFELAGLARSVSILKGKNNYVCLQTVADWLEDVQEIVHNQENAFTLATILHWLIQTKTGWLSELGNISDYRMVGRLARDEAVPRLVEPWAEIDPHKRAFDAAQNVDLVLVNQSYVFAIAKSESEIGAPLDSIVFDEAHNIENGVTEALTQNFRPWVIKAEISRLLNRKNEENKITGPIRPLVEFEGIKQKPIVMNFIQAMFAVEEGINNWCQICGERFNELLDSQYEETGKDIYNEDPDYPVLFTNDHFWIPNILESAEKLAVYFRDLLSMGESLLEEFPGYKGVPKRIQASISTFLQYVDENSQALTKILNFDDEDAVRWGEARLQVDENGNPLLLSNKIIWEGELHSTPLSVSEWLKKNLYPRYPHKFFVSATLAIGERFENILSKLGLISEGEENQPITHVFPSPFNYQDLVLLAVFSDSSYPSNSMDTLYLDNLTKNIAELCKLGEGRTLVLFTSRKTLQQVGLRLQAELENEDIIPLIQTQGNRAALVERFRLAPKEGEKLVLLGLRAFWEGIDIPGDPLRILVISRLPFDYFGHPVAEARKNSYLKDNPAGDYFREIIIPETFLHLRQMYGRLIRKEDDRGVCVFLDPRIIDRRYGRYLLNQLPLSQRISVPRDRGIEQIKKFLGGEQIEPEYVDAEQDITTSADISAEQMTIVNAPDKRILVRAAAGSGKTLVLTERIIRIVKDGHAPDPSRILALTYTVKAEKIMQERLYKSLGQNRGYELERNVITYHKFAARIIRSDYQGAGNEIVWINENSPEEKELFKFARSQSLLSDDELSDDDARTVIAFAQNGLVDEDQLKTKLDEFNSYTKKLAKFYLAYVQKLRENNLLDYGEAIVRAVKILRSDTDKHQKWANKFEWIFCDEYQDTSPAQSRLLDLIGQNANLFVVGDSAQSIYSWMGADPDNLYQFEKDFPGTIAYHLSKNYRSFPKLVKVSNRFLERCGQKHGFRVIWDEKRSNEDQNVFYLFSHTDDEEAKEVATLAKEALELQIPGEPPPTPTVGILARKWDLLKAVEIELIHQEVPYDFEGDTARGLRKDENIQMIIERVLNLLVQSQGNMEPGDTPDGKLVSALRNGQIDTADKLIDKVRIVLNLTGLDTGPRSDYKKFLNAFNGKPPSSLTKIYDRDERKGRVILSTVHSQKGEQFHTVFVIGLEKGNSPHQPPRSHQQILEWRKIVQKYSLASWKKDLNEDDLQHIYEQEEERIFYVAMTRACLNLIIGCSAIRNQRKFAASEFLEKAKVSNSVQDAHGAYEVGLAVPTLETQDGGYRSDGRLYWTNAGIRVRSKSEALLANELYRRGIYYEYELSPENVAGVLPDFTLPDYGDVIIEHLGLLDDESYRNHWEEKKKVYEEAGRLYIATIEQEIEDIKNTVDRILELSKNFAYEKYGRNYFDLIEIIQKLRLEKKIQINRPVMKFLDGVFYLEDQTNRGLRYIFFDKYSEIKNPTEIILESKEKIQWDKATYGEIDYYLGFLINE